MESRNRTLIIIGGHEDKKGNKEILKKVVERVGSGRLVICTAASDEPDRYFEEYERIFRNLGVRHIHKLVINSREEAKSDSRVRILDDATAVFFTGGDQLKITSQIGDTPIFQRLHDIYQEGGVIIGTSSGAAAMCETMIASGNGDKSHKLTSLRMAPGLALINGVIIDQHFAERGRMGRLLGAVAQNPRILGIGIDENTAIIVGQDREFYVVGDGAVYIMDGSGVSDSNIAEQANDATLSIYDVALHVLSKGDAFDLKERRPKRLSQHLVKKLLGQEAGAAQSAI
jgi:cyanophycinase